ncbi:hypothetical protein D3C84_612400 [compost metagenome]
MALVTGFWASKVLAVANELNLFTDLSRSGGITVVEFSRHYRIQPRPAEMLLTACAALGLLEKLDDRYANSRLSDCYLVRDKPMYFGGWIQMADRREYPAWMKLRQALHDNCPQTWDPNKQTSLFDGEDPDLVHELDGPAGAALMSLNMLIETWGRNYTAAEYSVWLKKTGFTHLETIRFDAPAANGAVIGYKTAPGIPTSQTFP